MPFQEEEKKVSDKSWFAYKASIASYIVCEFGGFENVLCELGIRRNKK